MPNPDIFHLAFHCGHLPDCHSICVAACWPVQDIIAAPLRADDQDIHLYPIVAFMPLVLDWPMWHAGLIQSSLHAAHDSGTASQGLHAQAVLAQHRAQRGGSRQSTHLCSLAAIAVR